MARVDYELNPIPQTKAILEKAFAVVVGQHKPPCFRPTDANVITQMEKGYEKLLVTLAECSCPTPESLTVFQFYTWLESLEEKYEEQKKALNQGNPKNAAKRQ